MSRYRGPRVRLQRRLGIRLDDLTKKRIRSRKRQNSLPGQHGYPRRRVRLSEYRMRLEEKQKLRFNYSVSERGQKNQRIYRINCSSTFRDET